jgi:signal transduction histidine kinase
MPDRNNSLLQSMLDASVHGMMLMEPAQDAAGAIKDFRIIAANAVSIQHLGFSINDKERPLLGVIFPNNDALGITNFFIETYASGKPVRKEIYYKDNRLEGWFDIGAAPTEEGLVVTFVNVTEKKQYQQKIEDQATRLTTILNIAQSGIFVFVPVYAEDGSVADFRFRESNEALAAYVGQEAKNIIGELGSKWFPGYKTNGLFERYRDTYLTGQTNRFDFHYNDDNIDVWLDIMSTRFEDSVVVTFTDFTHVKKLQLQYEELVAELKRSNENLEEFAYAASHDLQEPLRKIHFFSNRLKTGYEDKLGEDGVTMLHRMENAAKRMRILIDDLLAFSRASARRSQFEKTELNSIIREVLSDLETTITDKGAQVSVPQLPTVNGDPSQLRQLFQNLVGNALKYSHPDRKPAVAVEHKPCTGKESGLQLPSVDHDKNFHLITISDNGIGFEQQHAQKIFQLFQRLHGRAEYEGTGIGLAIVQKVVENHKGYIAATGVPGDGAIFKLLLPAA